MTGRPDLRLGISDVAPIVSCGSFSSRAVVGEHLPVTATVFREGHDAVAANVVWTAPERQGQGDRSSGWRSCRPSPTAGSPPSSRSRGAVDLLRRGLERPAGDLAARRRGEGGGRAGSRGAGQRPRGGRPAPRPGRRRRRCRVPRSGRRGGRRAARHLSGADRPHRSGPGAGLQKYLQEHPVRELVTRSPRYEVWVDRREALYGSWYEFFPRSEGPVVGGKPTHGTLRQRAGPAAGDRRHGLRHRLPATDPPDRHGEPQGPELDAVPGGNPTSGRTRSAPRGRSAARRAATTPSTRSWARWRTSAPSSTAPASSGWRSPWTSRCRRPRTTRGSPRTRSGSPPSPTAPSPTRRTRRRSTRTSTRSTSTTTPRASTPSACG